MRKQVYFNLSRTLQNTHSLANWNIALVRFTKILIKSQKNAHHVYPFVQTTKNVFSLQKKPSEQKQWPWMEKKSLFSSLRQFAKHQREKVNKLHVEKVLHLRNYVWVSLMVVLNWEIMKQFWWWRFSYTISGRLMKSVNLSIFPTPQRDSCLYSLV